MESTLPVAPQSITKGRVLVVDDDPAVARLMTRRLGGAGFQVECAANGEEAIALIAAETFDAIVSDITMPGIGGIELLRRVRLRDLATPVVMVTASPSVETAIRAVELGAYRYLVKPIASSELIEAVTGASRVARLARVKHEALTLLADGGQGVADRVGLEVCFERALSSLWVAYQPIVSWSTRTLFGYEALARTREPSIPHPGALFDAAERLARVQELGRTLRRRSATEFSAHPDGPLLFLNLHVDDLTETELFLPDSPLSPLASRVVLEITERSAIDEVRDLRARAVALRSLGFRLAIDDLGAGYAGLNSLALIEPEVVKLDMSLVRDIHREPLKQRIVKSMLSLCHEGSMLVVAEGVETVAERDQLAALGCDLMQGYLFAKPGPPFVGVTL